MRDWLHPLRVDQVPCKPCLIRIASACSLLGKVMVDHILGRERACCRKMGSPEATLGMSKRRDRRQGTPCPAVFAVPRAGFWAKTSAPDL